LPDIDIDSREYQIGAGRAAFWSQPLSVNDFIVQIEEIDSERMND